MTHEPASRHPDRASTAPALAAASTPLDRWTHAQWARLTGGLSLPALRMAYADWALHLAHNPSQQLALAQAALNGWQQWWRYAASSLLPGRQAGIALPVQDKRFAAPQWQAWPYNLWSQSFLLTEQWWEQATRDVHGVSKHHEEVVHFCVRQWLDLFSPANGVASNPEVLERTLSTGGANLVNGFGNWLADALRLRDKAPPVGAEDFKPGVQVAITPGQVVYRNHLIELIRYTPQTAQVLPEPVLVIPSWIMKYYILDLSPHNSLVRYLVAQGHTVYAISWRNPDASDRDLGMDDYLRHGVLDALDAVARYQPQRQVHAVGYCLGGTLLSIAAAALARDGDTRLASVSLLAAQTDFTEPGELDLFIDESQISLLEDVMWDQGFLDTQQMAGSFQLLNSRDLIWSRLLQEYLLGERSPLSDLMAWNADGTRLPYRMHSEYLRQLFLHNDLASGRYPVDGRAIALSDIQCPIYCVGTERDHVSPWRSVYKLHLLTATELCFTLSSGGHNVGIVNPPGVPGRSYRSRLRARAPHSRHLEADEWLQTAELAEGSWWTHWAQWLRARSGAPTAPPAPVRKALGAAPGTYVLQT